MTDTAHQITTNHITTDDLAFSAYLKMKGYRLIRCEQQRSKTIFTFSVNGNGQWPKNYGGPKTYEEPKSSEGLKASPEPNSGHGPKDGQQLKVEFINSPFLQYYNELRNLKKII